MIRHGHARETAENRDVSGKSGGRLRWNCSRAGRLLLAGIVLTLSATQWFGAKGQDESFGPPRPLKPMVVDVNTAPAPILEALPRLGPVLVGRILAARQDAPIRSLAELGLRVRGIGPVTESALRPYVVFGDHPTRSGQLGSRTSVGPSPRDR